MWWMNGIRVSERSVRKAPLDANSEARETGRLPSQEQGKLEKVHALKSRWGRGIRMSKEEKGEFIDVGKPVFKIIDPRSERIHPLIDNTSTLTRSYPNLDDIH